MQKPKKYPHRPHGPAWEKEASLREPLHVRRKRRSLRQRGFDRGLQGCSQCVAMMINGVACHETGCPNAK